MKYLRNSVFIPRGEAVTMVVPEDGLNRDIWTSANAMRRDAVRLPMRVDVEIFEFEGGLVEATLEAKRRAQTPLPDKIAHQATLHDHIVATWKTGLLADGGLITTSLPAPLDKQEILEVLFEVVKRPDYRGYVVSVHDRNGEPVRLHVDPKEKV